MNIPADLKYTSHDEWIRIDGDVVTLGITDFAQDALGELVHIEFPEVGDDLEVGGAVLSLGENTREISGAENRLFFKHTLQHDETELVISFIANADGPVRFGLFSASFDLLQNPLIKVLRPRFKNRTEAQMEKSFVLTDALVSFEEIKVP